MYARVYIHMYICTHDDNKRKANYNKNRKRQKHLDIYNIFFCSI